MRKKRVLDLKGTSTQIVGALNVMQDQVEIFASPFEVLNEKNSKGEFLVLMFVWYYEDTAE